MYKISRFALAALLSVSLSFNAEAFSLWSAPPAPHHKKHRHAKKVAAPHKMKAQLAIQTTTVNPNLPAFGTPLNSAIIRGNFAAAANDINNIYTQLGNSAFTAGPGVIIAAGVISLAPPSVTALGGARSFPAVEHQWLTGLSTSGGFVASQPAFADITGTVPNSQLDLMAASSIKGNISGGSASPIDLTGAQATALLSAFMGDSGTGGVKGLVPAPLPGDAAANKVLGASGTWVPQTGSGGGGGTGNVTGPNSSVSGDFALFDGTSGMLIKDGGVPAASATTDTTNASNITSGTLPAARLPAPTASTLGGVEAFATVSHQFLTGIGLNGVVSAAAPAAGDITGLATSATTDTTNASNITSGTLPAARLPAPTASTLGGVNSHAAVTHQFLTSIATTGASVGAQPVASDITGLATSATTDTTNASNITSGTLAAGRLPALSGDVACAAGSGSCTVNKVVGTEPITVQTITASSGTVAINLAAGQYVILNVSANITSMSITGWPAAGTLGKATIELRNTGAFSVTSWSGAIWAGGTAPTTTTGFGAKDIYTLVSGDAGTTVYGNIVGQNFQ